MSTCACGQPATNPRHRDGSGRMCPKCWAIAKVNKGRDWPTTCGYPEPVLHGEQGVGRSRMDWEERWAPEHIGVGDSLRLLNV